MLMNNAENHIADVTEYMQAVGERARAASRLINRASTAQKNAALLAIADSLNIRRDQLIVANQKDLDAFLEELSALYDKKTLLRLYQHATEAPYAFLYVKLTASNRDDMFYLNLSKKLSVEHIEE